MTNPHEWLGDRNDRQYANQLPIRDVMTDELPTMSQISRARAIAMTAQVPDTLYVCLPESLGFTQEDVTTACGGGVKLIHPEPIRAGTDEVRSCPVLLK